MKTNRWIVVGVLLLSIPISMCKSSARSGPEPHLVTGSVSVSVGQDAIALSEVLVVLEAEQPGEVVASSPTDLDGQFALRFGATLRNAQVCARPEGFEMACELVSLSDEVPTRVELVVEPRDGLVYGTVLDLDGRPCFFDSASFDTAERTRVELLDSSSTVVFATTANRLGEYALPLSATNSSSVRARCGGAEISEMLPPENGSLAYLPLDLMLSNRRPHISLVAALDDADAPLRLASAGQTVQVRVDASDPDGDLLTARWRSSIQGELQPDAPLASAIIPQIHWQLSTTPARNLLWVQVSDGKGGYAEDKVALATSDTGARFSGVLVNDDGNPVSDTVLRINETPSGRTDEAGHFMMSVPPADWYVLTVDDPHYALVSKVFDAPSTGIVVHLPASRRYVIDDGSDDFEVVDTTSGFSLVVNAGVLEDEQGNPPTGELQVDFHPYALDANDPGPGDSIGQTFDGGPQVVSILAAGSLLITDLAGKRYHVGEGETVQVTIPKFPKGQCPPPSPPMPPTMQVGHYDDNVGVWIAAADALVEHADGSGFDISTSELGAVSVQEVDFARNCLRLRADRFSMPVPLRVEFRRYRGCFNGEHPDYVFDQELLVADYEWHAVYGLRANEYYELEADPEGITGVPNRAPLVQHFRTGPANSFFTWTECDDREELLKQNVGPDNFLGTASEQDAIEYYQSIGAIPNKDTFAKWKAANGYSDSNPGVSVKFFNDTELGVGRAVTCLKPSSSKMACYIVKYGEPGGPVEETLDDLIHEHNPADTVAIDWAASKLDPTVRFYIYAPDGHLKTGTNFGTGEQRVPDVCAACHGGFFYYSPDEYPDPWFAGATMLPMDPETHTYSPELPRTSQEEKLRQINAMIASTKNAALFSVREYLDWIYPTGVQNAGSIAQDVVPPTWQAHGSEAAALYRDVFRTSCQTCHLQFHGRNWTRYDSAKYSQIELRVCGRLMPKAFVPRRNLWQGTGLPDRLMDHFGWQRCAPPQPTVDETPSPP